MKKKKNFCYENNVKCPIYMSKKLSEDKQDKHVEVDFTIHRDRKHFCCYSLDAFSTAEILKNNV